MKPTTYGAYQVINPEGNIDQICVHRDGFIIFMDNGIPMNSFRMGQNTFDKPIELTGYENERLFLKVTKEGKALFNFEISSMEKKESVVLLTEKENLSKYPLSTHKVHLTVD